MQRAGCQGTSPRLWVKDGFPEKVMPEDKAEGRVQVGRLNGEEACPRRRERGRDLLVELQEDQGSQRAGAQVRDGV